MNSAVPRSPFSGKRLVVPAKTNPHSLMSVTINLEIFEPHQRHEWSPPARSIVKRVLPSRSLSSGERTEGQIECVHVPQLSSVNPFWPGHRAVAHKLVELLAEIPMYIAASARERPRRGMARTAERAVERVMLPSPATGAASGTFAAESGRSHRAVRKRQRRHAEPKACSASPHSESNEWRIALLGVSTRFT